MPTAASSAVEFGVRPPAPCTSTAPELLLPPMGDADSGDSTDDQVMDALGARHLAARLRAGVRVGTTIVLEHDDPGTGLTAGDQGVVVEIAPDGIVVEWERGFTIMVDRQVLPYRTLSAA